MSQKGELDMDEMYNILGQEKPIRGNRLRFNRKDSTSISRLSLQEHQKVELIEKLVKDWHPAQSLKKGSR